MPSIATRTRVTTFVNQARQTENFGKLKQMLVNANAGAQRWSLVHFRRPPIPEGAVVQNAQLTLYPFQGASLSGSFTARRITRNWKKLRVNWNRRPDSAAANAATAVGTGSQPRVFDVTDLIQQLVNNPTLPWFGFRITGTATSNQRFFSGNSNATNRRPLLEVTWSEPPPGPIGLVPDGGLAVSLAQPKFLWLFRASKFGSDQGAFRFQIITEAGDFGSPLYDSDWVTSDEPMFDLAEGPGSPPSLTDGATYFWRVKVRDQDDLESDWSDEAEFQRVTKGALTITHPPNDPPDNTIFSMTPVITHTFTGDQEGTDYVIYEQDDEGSPNMIPNSSLEEGQSPWIIAGAPGWIDTGITTVADARHGTKVWRITETTGGTSGNIRGIRTGFDTVPASPGEVWTGSFWGIARDAGAELRVQVLFLDDSEANLASYIADIVVAQGEWARVTRVTPPAPANTAFVELRMFGMWTGTPGRRIDMDAAQLELGSEATDYAPKASDGGGVFEEVFRRGLDFTEETEFEVPVDVITRHNHRYKVEVHVRDDVERANLPGDPATVVAAREFVFQRDSGVAGVSLLEAISGRDPSKGVTLRWFRSTPPDFFSLRVNGVSVNQRIDPDTVFTGASPRNYAMKFLNAVPEDSFTFEVEAIEEVSGQLHVSASNTVVSHIMRPIGAWLFDTEVEEGVIIVENAGAFEIGEMSTVHTPINSRRPVRVYESIRGYEGNVSGIIIDYGGKTAEEYRDMLLKFKGQLGSRELRLVAPGINIPVEIGRVMISPGEEIGTFAVSVDFTQVGEYTFKVIAP